MGNDNEFITKYIQYRKETEPPVLFHRWACISMLAAYLGRNFRFDLGEFKIYPNMYTMLIGVPGTRKSTAIKLAKKLLKQTGYSKFSADKSSKEKFILDLAGDAFDSADNLLDTNLWGDDESSINSEMYIACDEFNNFIGNGNIEFISLLGEFWDYEGTYTNRIKNGKSVSVPNPTINILGGNTATGFSLAFPVNTIGQGFFSRLLLIYSDPSEKRITFPEKPDELYTRELIDDLSAIHTQCSGIATVSHSGRLLLDKIYKQNRIVDDVRFEHYSNRRFTHLLKLCLVCCAARLSCEIDDRDIIYANTILTHTEKFMPKALGEFGKSKNSDVSHKIISVLEQHYKPLSIMEIWRYVGQDMDKLQDLSNVLYGLSSAGKILSVDGGFLAKRLVIEKEYSDVIDYGMLTSEEIGE